MRYNTKEFGNVSVQTAFFQKEGRTAEYHMMLHVLPEGSFSEQLAAVHAAFDQAVAEISGNPCPVFIRYFLSDISNQTEILRDSLEGRQQCAVSIIGQPPLDGSKVAMWAYLVSDTTVEECEGGLWKADYLGYDHLWLGDACGCGKDSEEQTEALLDSYSAALAAHGCDIPQHCLRTWFFVQDVDVNYSGVVTGRKGRFDRMGLTQETHYLASTGIAGSNALRDSCVTLDAYAAVGMPQEKISYLKGSTHLNPTHEYGVTFERGTAVDYGDRRHVVISGTASIDNKGQIVHPGDVKAQTLRMWENVEVLLDEAGCTYDDVMHMIVYLRDIADHAAVKSLYDERFPDHPKVFVWAPVCRPGWLIEMECMAVRQSDNE